MFIVYKFYNNWVTNDGENSTSFPLRNQWHYFTGYLLNFPEDKFDLVYNRKYLLSFPAS